LWGEEVEFPNAEALPAENGGWEKAELESGFWGFTKLPNTDEA